MSISLWRYKRGRIGLGPCCIILFGLIKSIAAAAYTTLVGCKHFYGFWLQVPLSVQFTTIEQHLVEQGKVVCIGEQACMSCHSAKHRCAFIMHIPTCKLPAKMFFLFCGYDPLQRETLTR